MRDHENTQSDFDLLARRTRTHQTTGVKTPHSAGVSAPIGHRFVFFTQVLLDRRKQVSSQAAAKIRNEKRRF